MRKTQDPSVFRVDRRQFLRGTGGAILALPLLPSLLSAREAKAAETQRPKCFVHVRTPHGAIITSNMWPAASALSETLRYAGHDVRRGNLTAQVNASDEAVISRVLTARSSVLTPSLVSKMNMLRGLDFPLYMGHNFGAALGYYDEDKGRPGSPRATIDQIMAYSPAFYPSVASVRKRSVAIASSGASSGSWGYNTPGNRSSGVASSDVSSIESSLALFDVLLAGAGGSTNPSRPPLVDRIFESYRRLRNGNGRLSAEDRVRLDQHINSVAELQRRLGTVVHGACEVPARPTTDNLSLKNSASFAGDPAKNVEYFRLINEVLAVAMSCGTCRVATITIDENNQNLTFTTRAPQGEDWHNNVVHAGTAPGDEQDLVVQFNKVFFSEVFLDLVGRFERISNGVGGTLLDDSLVAWGQENGNYPHYSFSVPVVTAGSAGGALRTGNYCDYRNLNHNLDGSNSSEDESLWPGLLFNQWLGTALQAMGVPHAEWSEADHPGFGWKTTYQSQYAYFFTNTGLTADKVYHSEMWAKTGEILPFLAP